jgi:hypothetical protein
MTFSRLAIIFTHIEPFRSTLLRMLLPFEIAQLLVALHCQLSEWEAKTHMNLMQDVFQDCGEISKLCDLGLTVRIFGADLDLLKQRLEDPLTYIKSHGKERMFSVFVMVSERPSLENGHTSAFARDFRPVSQHQSEPDDMSVTQLSQSFPLVTANSIQFLARWIFCAPYLAGSLPTAVPGWIPVFNAQANVNVRAYISTFKDRNNHLLYLDRELMDRVFGYQVHQDLLLNLTNLRTVCYILKGSSTVLKHLNGHLTMNTIHAHLQNIHNKKHCILQNTLYPLGYCITLKIP